MVLASGPAHHPASGGGAAVSGLYDGGQAPEHPFPHHPSHRAPPAFFSPGVELLIDRYFLGRWQPGWSLVVLTVCAALVIPLIVVRRVPALREEVRRRFHL